MTPMSADPTEALARWLTLGQAALDRGDPGAAADAFEQVHTLLPTDASVALMVANAYRLAGSAMQARATLVRAVAACDWRAPETAHALAAALLENGAPRDALVCARAVVAARPKDGAALGALAAVLRVLGEPEEAWTHIDRAVRLAPRLPALLVTAAQIRHDLGDLDGADRFYMRALALRPAHAPTQLQRAYSVLTRGASAEGWSLFEHRPLPEPATAARPWFGEPLAGDTMLVTGEQGVGDQFQFARFLPWLTARGAGRVVVECHRDAVSLFAANGIEAVPRGAPPETAWHVPLLSLPARLGLGADVQGERVPYLRAPHPEPRDGGGRPRVGLVWAGNPAFPGGATRDCDPAHRDALLAIPAVDWVILQHGLTDAERASLSDRGYTVAPPTSSWEATANRLASLDGLVTTDTGIAHLAGAMGVRSWVMLQHVPDWRWGLRGTTSIWYPSTTLLRPDRWNDWPSVVARAAAALATAF